MTVKTNAIRMIESQKVPYSIYEYDASEGFVDGVSAAHASGLEAERVFKTLVVQGNSREYYVCVIPVAAHLDLKKAAKHFGEKKVEMIPARDLIQITGYKKGGCSPIGMKKKLKTAVDDSAAGYNQIVVSAGKVGLQLDIPTGSLLNITDGLAVPLTED